MVILGLDPGSHHTGYGFIEKQGDRLVPIEFGRISSPRNSSITERLAFIAAELDRLLSRSRPNLSALESPFHGLNAKSLVVLAQARGALLATLGSYGLAVAEYSPAEVKSAVVGNGRADKQQVAHMVGLTLGIGTSKLSHDATDALAVAICCALRQRLNQLTEES
jgi:crossover junction endodeoxyribonuclease RuvC